MMSVVSARSGIAARSSATSRRYRSREYVRRIAFRIRLEPDCSGRCACSQTAAHSAIAAMTSRRKSFGCGLVKRMRSIPGDRVDGAQELREARADVAPVRVDVLAEQRHLADTVTRRAARSRRGSRRGGGTSRARGRRGRCSRSRPSCSPSRPAPRPGSAARGAREAEPRRPAPRRCRTRRARRPSPPAPSQSPRCEIVPGPNATSTSG